MGEKITVTKQVYYTLRERILKGTYPEGMQLQQDSLASQLGVSRIPVREALIQLSSEGLVRFAPYKGAMVTGLSCGELWEIFEIRYALESVALRHAIARITDDDVQRLQAILSKDREISARPLGDGELWSSMNWKFHMELYKIAGRPRLMELINAQHLQVDRYLRIYLEEMGYQEDSLEAHSAILQCCRIRDAVEATVLLHDHLKKACLRLSDYLFPRDQPQKADLSGFSLVPPLMAPCQVS